MPIGPGQAGWMPGHVAHAQRPLIPPSLGHSATTLHRNADEPGPQQSQAQRRGRWASEIATSCQCRQGSSEPPICIGTKPAA